MGEGLQARLKQTRFESPVQEAMLSLLVASAHLREQFEGVWADFGVTQAQFNILRILRGACPTTFPLGYPRCEIAPRMIERALDVTRLIDRLDAAGWASRARSGEDRRLSLARITDAGRQLLDEIQPRIDEIHRQLADRLTADEFEQLSALCEKLYGSESAADCPEASDFHPEPVR